MTLLEAKNITLSFGGITALDDVTLIVPQGNIVGLIGSNGAGKSTLLNTITRHYTPNRGSVTFTGENILTHSKYEISKLGIARTFQNLELFESQSVFDNVIFGYFQDVVQTAKTFSIKKFIRFSKRVNQSVDTLLDDMNLNKYRDMKVKDLPYAYQKTTELARAIASRPKLLLLDEPTSGMGASESYDFKKMLLRIKQSYDLTILIVAHDMPLIFDICDHIYVLDHGKIIADGSSTDIANNENVKRSYLGEIT